MTALGTAHHYSRGLAAIWAAGVALVTIFTSVVAAYFLYKRDFEPLPGIVAAQGKQISELENQIKFLSPPASAMEWVGIWRGKWNDTWRVQFTIFYTYGKTYLVIYSHEEQPNSQMTETTDIGTAEGGIMTWGSGYTIRKTSATTAEAVGIFQKGNGVKATLSKLQ